MIKPHDKPYDSGLKRLLTICTQDFLDWLIPGATFTGKRSGQFQSLALEADILLEALQDDVLILFNLEGQSTSDPFMADRLLEYSVLARRHYQYKCIARSYVIFLRKGGARPEPPLTWKSPDGTVILRFDFEVIELADIPYEKLVAKGLRGLLALVPLAKGGARREVVVEVISLLQSRDDIIARELISLTVLFASLVLTNEEDKKWVIGRVEMLQDILRETPVYQFILQEGLKEGIEKGKKEESQARLLSLRGRLEAFLDRRFPPLTPLAKQQLSTVTNPQTIEALFFDIALAPNMKKAEDILKNIQEQE